VPRHQSENCASTERDRAGEDSESVVENELTGEGETGDMVSVRTREKKLKKEKKGKWEAGEWSGEREESCVRGRRGKRGSRGEGRRR
jgi:hypothetical protein